MSGGRIYFDDALPALVRGVASKLGNDGLAAGIVLRDAVGRLSFFSAIDLAEDVRRDLVASLRDVLGPYAPEDGLVVGPADPMHALISAEPAALWVRCDGLRLRLVDRRIAGADWLRTPAPVAPDPVRFVFTSLKGGAGRSTALAVAAAHFAEQGKRVLAVDLDLEAPGLGAFLLPEVQTPRFGLIDALVENGLHALDEAFLADLVGASPLAQSGGRIDVIPAFGSRSLEHPEEVLAKLARAYAEDVLPDGRVASILDQISALIERFARPDRYDLVLVDARAGLHETTAASVLGLGAEVLLFGRDERQTFQGYAALLAHLSRLIKPDEHVPEWVERLTPVHALAPADARARDRFQSRWETLVRSHGPLASRQQPGPAVPAEGVREVPWDETVPDEDVIREVHEREWSLLHPIVVLRDSNFEGFDPLAGRDRLSLELRRATFGGLLDVIEQCLAMPAAEGP